MPTAVILSVASVQRPLRRQGLEPGDHVTVDPVPNVDADDPLGRMLSRLAGLADPDVLAAMVDVDVVEPPMVGDRIGDLIRGMAAAAAQAGRHPRAASDVVDERAADVADGRTGAADVRIPRPRQTSSAQPKDRTPGSVRRRAPSAVDVE